MYDLIQPPFWMTVAFAVLTIVVIAADVALIRLAAPEDRRRRWTILALVAAPSWLAVHAVVAESGVLEGTSFPPPAMPYLVVTVLVALAVVFSPVGARLRQLPLMWLVALQSFRLPLEWLLHQLYEVGTLPVQMTWSGYNFDVLTAIGAIVIAAALWRGRQVPDRVIMAWNVVGFALLLNVVAIALLSAPLPVRQFHNEPAVLLLYHAPFNWIVNVHVFTALVGHLVIFGALGSSWRRRAEA